MIDEQIILKWCSKILKEKQLGRQEKDGLNEIIKIYKVYQNKTMN